MSSNEFSHQISLPPPCDRSKALPKNQTTHAQNNLPSLSREHFRPLFPFSTPWYSSCVDNPVPGPVSSEVLPGRIFSNETPCRPFEEASFASNVRGSLEAGLLDEAVEIVPNDGPPIPRATAGSDPPCCLQQNDFKITSRTTASGANELSRDKIMARHSSSHSDVTIGCESWSESDDNFSDTGSTQYSEKERDAAGYSKAADSESSGSTTCSLQAYKEDKISPCDVKVDTETSSFEEISNETENVLDVDVVLEDTYSINLDAKIENVLSLQSTAGAWRSQCSTECSIPGLEDKYDSLLAVLSHTHAQVTVMKQQYREILEDLRKKLM
ncbi:hypothetical protein GCK32_010035 [Trichostrongylus colubriformis]|uniref:Uncharacterized protein n=1 Tax=Trichostrongylus colubriformis TaxID=6319 RepID=A0AAN8EUD1_TRICO